MRNSQKSSCQLGKGCRVGDSGSSWNRIYFKEEKVGIFCNGPEGLRYVLISWTAAPWMFLEFARIQTRQRNMNIRRKKGYMCKRGAVSSSSGGLSAAILQRTLLSCSGRERALCSIAFMLDCRVWGSRDRVMLLQPPSIPPPCAKQQIEGSGRGNSDDGCLTRHRRGHRKKLRSAGIRSSDWQYKTAEGSGDPGWCLRAMMTPPGAPPQYGRRRRPWKCVGNPT